MDWLVREMDKDGIMMQDMGLIIITHAHPDHYGAAQEVKKMSGALIAISKEEHDFLETVENKCLGCLSQWASTYPR